MLQLEFPTPTKRPTPALDRQERRQRLAQATDSLAANFDTSNLQNPADLILEQAALLAIHRNISLESATNILLNLTLKQLPQPIARKQIELPNL